MSDLAELRMVTHSPSQDMRAISQEAIPWCTTHDMTIIGDDDYCWKIDYDKLDCVISSGGLDHKWWKDQ